MSGRGDHPPDPPRPARWLLRQLLPPAERERILADLDEFHRRRAVDGRSHSLWYWRQLAHYLVRWRQLRPGGSLVRETRQAMRSLLRAPMATVPAVLTLGLAVGANVAVFAVVDGLLLAPLPYEEPGALMQLWMEDPEDTPGSEKWVSSRAYETWAARSSSLEGMGRFQTSVVTLSNPGPPAEERVVDVDPRLLDRLGPRPALGRLPTHDEAAHDAPVLLLSHAFWSDRLGADPDVVGRQLTVEGRRHRVVGVVEPHFRFPMDREVLGWRSTSFDDPLPSMADLPLWGVVGWAGETLGPADAEAVRAELQELLPEPLADTWGGSYDRVRVASMESLSRPAGTLLVPLLGAVALVVFLACLNVVQLLLARGLVRAPELAVRAALGAGRGEMIRMFLLEGVLLSGMATALGLVLAGPTLHLLLALDPGHLPGWASLGITPRVGVYLGCLAVAVTTLVGVLPGLRAVGTAPAKPLAHHRAGGASSALGLQRGLLAAQTAVALMVLTGGALVLRSWSEVRRVDPGFDSPRTYAAAIRLPTGRYDPGDGAAHLRFFEELRQGLAAHPGLGSAAVSAGLPTARSLDFAVSYAAEGGSRDGRQIPTRNVSPGYFRTLGIDLLAGRDFTTSDGPEAPRVAILNRQAARSLLGTVEADRVVGARLGFPGDSLRGSLRVIGLVEDVHQDGPDQPAPPMIYRTYHQGRPFGRMWVSVRPRRDGDPVWAVMRQVLGRIDPALPLLDPRSMAERITATTAPRRFSLFLIGALTLLSLVVAVGGLMGLASLVASRARRQVAIRSALGAGSLRALLPAVAANLSAVGGGMALGLLGVVAIREALRPFLFGVAPLDPWSLAGALLLLSAVAAAATLLPAWRAGRADPREVLDG